MPNDRLGFRPHEKSWTLEQMAAHLANPISWAEPTLKTTELDLSKPQERPTLESNKAILERFDAMRDQARAAIA